MSKKQEKEENEFNIADLYKNVNPFLVDGFKKYIFANGIKIKNEKEFDKAIETYGGF